MSFVTSAYMELPELWPDGAHVNSKIWQVITGGYFVTGHDDDDDDNNDGGGGSCDCVGDTVVP
jgi:hypothetical protein